MLTPDVHYLSGNAHHDAQEHAAHVLLFGNVPTVIDADPFAACEAAADAACEEVLIADTLAQWAAGLPECWQAML